MGNGSDYYYADGANTYDATSTLFDGNWHHVALTINAEIQKFYIDGVLVHTHDTTDAATRSGGTSAVLGTVGTDDLVIGRYGGYNGGYWDGSIDEVAIFESELSAAQVVAIYNGGVPADLNSLSPDAWWRMGDGDTYPTLQDSSANNVTGTMINMTSTDIVTETP